MPNIDLEPAPSAPGRCLRALDALPSRFASVEFIARLFLKQTQITLVHRTGFLNEMLF
jgi:hypothetical protein